jgi:hypothetical protein
MNQDGMTEEQRQILTQSLAQIMENLKNVLVQLRACYGEEDPPVFRAEEAGAAVQRLIWALERQSQAATGGGAA